MKLISDTHTITTGKPPEFTEVPPGQPFDGDRSLVDRGIARPYSGAGDAAADSTEDETGAGESGTGESGGDEAGQQTDTGDAGTESEGDETPDVININTATAEQLAEVIPRVGTQTAADIVARREAEPFKSVDDLAAVGGVGRSSIAKVRERLTV